MVITHGHILEALSDPVIGKTAVLWRLKLKGSRLDSGYLVWGRQPLCTSIPFQFRRALTIYRLEVLAQQIYVRHNIYILAGLASGIAIIIQIVSCGALNSLR